MGHIRPSKMGSKRRLMLLSCMDKIEVIHVYSNNYIHLMLYTLVSL